jgi:hypothetical protein
MSNIGMNRMRLPREAGLKPRRLRRIIFVLQ